MSKHPVRPPIIVSERGDVDVFESIEDAEAYLESYDADVLIAYDSEGRLLHLKPTFPKITITAKEWVPTHGEDVQRLLVKFLGEVGELTESIDGKSLAELVSASLKYKTR